MHADVVDNARSRAMSNVSEHDDTDPTFRIEADEQLEVEGATVGQHQAVRCCQQKIVAALRPRCSPYSGQ